MYSTEDAINEIVKRLSPKHMRSFGRNLGLNNADIDQILHDHRNDSKEVMRQIILAWGQQFSPKEPVKILAKVLRKINDVRLAETIYPEINEETKEETRENQFPTTTDEAIDIIYTELHFQDIKPLARNLRLKEAVIEQIITDYTIYGAAECICQLLIEWNQQLGRRATIKELATQLSKSGRRDLMEMILPNVTQNQENYEDEIKNAPAEIHQHQEEPEKPDTKPNRRRSSTQSDDETGDESTEDQTKKDESTEDQTKKDEFTILKKIANWITEVPLRIKVPIVIVSLILSLKCLGIDTTDFLEAIEKASTIYLSVFT